MLDLLIASRSDHGLAITEVYLRGDLDIAAAERMQAECEALLADDARALLIDVSGVAFLDVAGMRALLALRTHAWMLGRPLAIVTGENCRVERVLDLLGWRCVLPLYPDWSRAAATLAAAR